MRTENQPSIHNTPSAKYKNSLVCQKPCPIVASNRERKVHVVIQQNGNSSNANKTRFTWRDHSIGGIPSSISVESMAARIDFIPRLPVLRLACSCARRFARLSTSANDMRVRRWLPNGRFAGVLIRRLPIPFTGNNTITDFLMNQAGTSKIA
jgi:hypothetical protein